MPDASPSYDPVPRKPLIATRISCRITRGSARFFLELFSIAALCIQRFGATTGAAGISEGYRSGLLQLWQSAHLVQYQQYGGLNPESVTRRTTFECPPLILDEKDFPRSEKRTI